MTSEPDWRAVATVLIRSKAPLELGPHFNLRERTPSSASARTLVGASGLLFAANLGQAGFVLGAVWSRALDEKARLPGEPPAAIHLERGEQEDKRRRDRRPAGRRAGHRDGAAPYVTSRDANGRYGKTQLLGGTIAQNMRLGTP